MADEYYRSPVDSFFASTDIMPRDNESFGHTDKEKEEERQKLLQVVKRREKSEV